MKASQDVQKVHDVKKMPEMAAVMKTGSVKDYNEWANECSKNADSASKKIFEALVDDEERHYDQYDKETENLTKFEDNYLALSQLKEVKTLEQVILRSK